MAEDERISAAATTDAAAAAAVAGTHEFLQESEEKMLLNQYWYSARTLDAIVAEVDEVATRAAFLSTPSVYFSLRNKELRERSFLFEFDTQWEKDRGFVLYDFREPERVPEELLHTFDYVVIDPPFITDEVWAQYARTARALLVEGSDEAGVPRGKVLCTTIRENAEMLFRELSGARPQAFQPAVPNLPYQYDLFLNYESARMSEPNPEIHGVEHHGKTSYKPPTGVGHISSDEYFGREPAAAASGDDDDRSENCIAS